jgi:hypothetical protein
MERVGIDGEGLIHRSDLNLRVSDSSVDEIVLRLGTGIMATRYSNGYAKISGYRWIEYECVVTIITKGKRYPPSVLPPLGTTQGKLPGLPGLPGMPLYWCRVSSVIALR